MIAIENVRLFKELQERNAELRRPWSIKRQRPKCSASLASSPTDVQPVLDAIVESARGFAGIDDVICASVEVNVMDCARPFWYYLMSREFRPMIQ